MEEPGLRGREPLRCLVSDIALLLTLGLCIPFLGFPVTKSNRLG